MSANASVPGLPHWTHRVGQRRTWLWRGWPIHYSYAQPIENPMPPVEPAAVTGALVDQTPMLLLHGFGASIGHWRKNIAVLSQTHPVYALDLLGFGQSAKAMANYDTALWVDQVYEFWRAFIGRPVVLVGHSLGSTVGLTIAARHPEMLASLVMFTLPDASVLDLPAWLRSTQLKPFVNLPLAGLKRLLTAPLIFAPLFRLIRRPQVIQKWAKSAYMMSEVVDEELVDVFSSPAYDRGATRALASMINAKNLDAERFSARAVLPRLTMPMLLIWGKQDKAVPPLLAPKFLQYNSKIELIELDNVGHCAHDECPDAMNRILLDWIAKQTVQCVR
ncbi:alpha/beta fold hydrolase [filamentous cyanobacterium LEGE 11480]|uniref:Alpha/beta fold hydrolase n=1 Tax=Romeriopsis navalis LEGE 11480 TaxID=2777977 RepID=A0A928VS09_9CYAN|nr:alpha/beta fold hydrolase [Romeriopsis navalis]MBE9031124.1 alpha/beta fold hydrolase [Romeriopsis navalis LEGE 11480]